MIPKTQWDWLAVAQHYGLPTRLLDWSVNALSAAWFAVARPARSRDAYGVIWSYEAREGVLEKGGDYIGSSRSNAPFSIAHTGILVPRYVSKRIVAQGGYFTVQTRTANPPHFVPLDQEDSFKGRLQKWAIPAACFPEFRQQLTRLGANAMSIYPDLGGLCQDIKWRYSYADDEGSTAPK